MAKAAGFEAVLPDGDFMTIGQISSGQDIHKFAPVVERIISEGYVAQFEPSLVPMGAVREYLADSGNEAYVARREARMRRSTREGSVYYGAWVTDGDNSYGTLVGVAKSTPSRPRWRKSLYPDANKDVKANCFLNDVVVLPRFQRRGVGSALAWAAMVGYGEDRAGVLNAFEGNEAVNSWFKSLSFHRRQGINVEAFEIGSHTIPQTRMEATALKGVTAVLLQKRPWLADVKVLDS